MPYLFIVLASISMFFAANYSIAAHLVEDKKQGMYYYVVSFSMILISVIMIALIDF